MRWVKYAGDLIPRNKLSPSIIIQIQHYSNEHADYIFKLSEYDSVTFI